MDWITLQAILMCWFGVFMLVCAAIRGKAKSMERESDRELAEEIKEEREASLESDRQRIMMDEAHREYLDAISGANSFSF